jgi:hypothetical protein
VCYIVASPPAYQFHFAWIAMCFMLFVSLLGRRNFGISETTVMIAR